MSRQLRFAVVGTRRGHGFDGTIHRHPDTTIAAVCDLDRDKASQAAARFEAEVYTDYQQMLAQAKLDAVILATPMPLHVSQAVPALERNIHVLSEVPAAVSLAEAKRLVSAARQSKAIYMMAENYCYYWQNMMIGQMVRAGLFGEVYFAEGEYLHNLRGVIKNRTWYRQSLLGINGCTYSTHALGPVLSWLPDQRVASICCTGSGNHYRDEQGGAYEQEDTVLMLCRLSGGGLVKIRQDFLSFRPGAPRYCLQGTEGCYESDYSLPEPDRIWIKGRSQKGWQRLEDYKKEFLPECWRNPPADIGDYDHHGADYYQAMDFIEALTSRKSNPMDVDRAMDLTLPGLISQQSIARGGIWLEVPDSRVWS